MNTSQKHRNFVSEPVGNKGVKALPGVGPVTAERLKNAGYHKAKNVLGEYLAKDESSDRFQGWMNNQTGANSKQTSDCYNGLQEYSKEFI